MNIIIGANIANAQAGLTTVSKELATTASAAAKVDSSLDHASGAVSKAKTNFTGLSRVVQDLPFGFIAISNNLEQLLPAAGGLGLAFSALISAISFLQIGFGNWTRGLGDSSKAMRQSEEEAKKFNEALNSAAEGATAIGIKLQAFVSIGRDTTKSIAERNYALTQANKILGEHGEKLTLVNINTSKVTEQVNILTQALINEAVAAKYADRAADLTIKQAEAAKAYGAALKEYNRLAKEAEDLNKLSVSGGSGGVGGLGNVSAINKARTAYNSLVDAADSYKQVTKDLHETFAEFTSTQSKTISGFAAIDAAADETKKSFEKIKPLKVSDFFLVNTNIKNIPTQYLDQTAVETGDHIHVEIQKNLDRQPALKVAKNIDYTQLDAFADKVSKIISDTLINVAEVAGDVIGNLFTGQKNPFSSLFQVIGTGVKNLGKQLIEFSVLAKLTQKALTFAISNPTLALVAGIALEALGSVIQKQGVRTFATGGVVTGPTLALVGENGPERITPLSQISNGGNNIIQGEVTFNITGQNLRGVLRQANQTANYNF